MCIDGPARRVLALWIYIYTLAEGIMISVRSLQRSVADVSDPIKCIYSWSASLVDSI